MYAKAWYWLTSRKSKYMRKTKPIIIWQRRQAAADSTGSGEQLDRWVL